MEMIIYSVVHSIGVLFIIVHMHVHYCAKVLGHPDIVLRLYENVVLHLKYERLEITYCLEILNSISSVIFLL